VRIPSPQGIPFDQVPELSLTQVVSEVVCGINQGYDLIVTNFANGDVIGHTQNQSAKLRCAEFVDTQLGRVMNAALAADYAVIITADHGNLEEMFHPDGSPHVAHTANLVPFTLIDPRSAIPVSVQDGKLSDVAPTVLHALGLVPPKAMHGVNLAPEHNWGSSRRVLLLILDGWGIGKADVTNPIFLAQTPAWDDLAHRYPGSRLQASGEAVGLQPGKPGNSEAGHINIGAGRVVLQDDMRLDLAMKDGSFFANETLLSAITKAKQRCGRLHLLALLSENSSHGSMAYPLALLEMAKSNGLKDVYMHIIFDGRSTEPGSAPALLENLESKLAVLGIGQIVSGMGRCLALDRDSNYGKTQRAYDALVLGIGKSVRANEGGSPC
jgi:2,3-bisphosphoglycerate-independent phosphoglycerate mutase